MAKVWALMVGGGGSGGGGCTYVSTNHGGAGGGGAGGYVENNQLTLFGGEGAEGDYTITVGAGGAARLGTTKVVGNNGQDSTFIGPGSTPVMVAAKGGGGGGGETDGAAGGSGGGGSRQFNRRGPIAHFGGASNQEAPGLGFKGGDDGNVDTVGAGGGGASEAGTPTTLKTAGKGGDGKASSITGTSVYYAGGGGGACTDTSTGCTAAAGGLGGGGHGGDGTEETQLLVDGVDGLGGGGGGGSKIEASGKGGDGVVIVRISYVIDGTLKKPTDFDVTYTGEEIVADTSVDGVYKVDGENRATVVRATPYAYTVTLEPGLHWGDDPTDTAPVEVKWRILPATVEPPVQLIERVVYDGEDHVAVNPSPKYGFPGVGEGLNQTNATTAAKYYFEAELTDKWNTRWTDGSDTNLTYRWEITPRPVDFQNLPQGVVYGGTNVVAVTNNDLYAFADGSTTSATNAGRYAIVYELNDKVNYAWSNDGSSTNQTYYWEIARLPVDYPPLQGDEGTFVYDGQNHTVATNTTYYALTGNREVDVGEYTATARLNDNWCWKEEPTTADYVIDWQIVIAKNEITSLKLADWKFGDPRNWPSIEAKFGANTVEYSYGKSEKGPWVSDDEVAELLNTNGTFYVKAFIPATANYSAAERTKKFLIYKSFDELFTDYVDLDFPNYPGDALEDFVVLVKISEALYPGFSYARCGDGESLGFFDMTEGLDPKPLPYEVDTWNPSGESLVWVKVPRLLSKEGFAKTKIRMYWHLKEGMSAPGSAPVDVWSDYDGVWHFNETIGAAAAPTTPSHDSTEHGWNAVPRATGTGDLAQMTSYGSGMIGNARTINSASLPNGGNNLVADGVSGLGTNFFFSGWVKVDGYMLSPWILSGGDAEDATQFGIAINLANRKQIDLYGAGLVTTPSAIVDDYLANGWVQLNLVVSGKKYWLFPKSPTLKTYERSGNLTEAVGAQISKLIFGCDPTGAKPSLFGKVDEFRVSGLGEVEGQVEDRVAALKSRIDVEFQNTTNATSFVHHDWIVVEGVKQNWWKTEPKLSKTSWEAGGTPATVNLGEPAIGSVEYVCERLFDGGLSVTNALPTTPGRYVISFTCAVEGFNTLRKEQTFEIIGHSGTSVIGQTEEGRVLLANDDSQGDWGDTSVTNQAYWLSRLGASYEEVIGYEVITNYDRRGRIESIVTNAITHTVTPTNATYWVHSGESLDDWFLRPFVLTNSIHTLETTNRVDGICGSKRIWHLENVMIGNLWQPTFNNNQNLNYLPWSETSQPVSSNGAVWTQGEVSHMMLRNIKGAAIYSPCYTNGIGTIYFDAVNSHKNVSATTPKAENYHLAIEMATCVTNEQGEVICDEFGQPLLPTDANVNDVGWKTNYEWQADGETCITNIYFYSNENFYARAKWEPVKAMRLEIKDTEVKKLAETEDLEIYLDRGGSIKDFYRVIAQVDVRTPARFRIRRTSYKPEYTIDNNCYILLDNIVVSKPPMRVDMESLGELDLAKGGPTVLGMECATSIPYPAATDTEIYGRGRAKYSTSGDASADTNAFIKGVEMHYRWRYLNQTSIEGGTDWTGNVVQMRLRNGLIETYSPLEHPLAEGDIEYWYKVFLQAPFYIYVDYSGSNHGLKDKDGRELYTEELREINNHFHNHPSYARLGGQGLPSLGSDWFFRLRNGRDDHGSAVLVVNEGKIAGNYPMHLAEDNTWRCLLPLPKDASGPCKFYFELRDEQTPGATEFVRNVTCYSPEESTVAFPAKGRLVRDAAVPCTFEIDHAATHLEWRFNDRYDSYAVTRAEYQNFNEWSDIHSKPTGGRADFYANFVDTNGVNVVDMKDYPAPLADWPCYVATNKNWNEVFYVTDSNDPGYPKDQLFDAHQTPSSWAATKITFVSELLGGNLEKGYQGDKNEYYPTPKLSGMAGKLLGQGSGRLDFALDERPNGVERVTFKARIGQSVEFDKFAYSQTALWKENYMFTALANMSHMITDNKKEVDMAAGASMSMVAYYQPGWGCYEFRVERIEQGTYLMMSIWKWHLVDGAVKADCLVKRRMDNGYYLWTNNSADPAASHTVDNANNRNPQYRMMFVSASNATDRVVIHGGISYDAQLPYKSSGELSFNKLYNGYTGLYYEDTASDRLDYGSYGVGAKDCPAEFLKPRHNENPVTNIKLVNKNTGDYTYLAGRTDTKARHFVLGDNRSKDIGVGPDQLVDDLPEIRGDFTRGHSQWMLPPNRIEWFANTWKTLASTHQGLRIPTGLKQEVKVLLAPKDRPAQWEEVGTRTVSGYGFTSYELPLYRKGQYNLRLTTGAIAVDAVVDDVQQVQWMGEDLPGIDTASGKFVYTQGHVVTNAAKGRQEINLVPARAKADKALSIRSPILANGLGKIAFNYENVHTNAEIWVQVATNHVSGRLTGANGYNDSIKSLDWGQDEPSGTWLTVAKYKFRNPSDPELALGSSGRKVTYVGLHNQKDRPIEGLFRLFIPPAVVEKTDTMTSEQLDKGGKDYGRVTITGVTVWDEPGLDDRSWRGWNLRSVGDDKDTEKRMYLCDMTLQGREGEEVDGYGLVCALNNSVKDVVTDDETKVRTAFPTVWTPTLGVYTNEFGEATQDGVGEVTFKARVYGTRVETAKGGRVTLWGASNSVLGKWERLAEFTVDQPYFQNYSWKAGAESYAALKFEISDPSARTTDGLTDRVVLDEITVCERVQPTLTFKYAWPFRDGLNGDEPIANLGDPAQQPLAGENWGVQTQLALQQLGDEVDLERGLEVYLSYYSCVGKPAAADWGYQMWKDRATGEVRLEAVGEPTNMVFRSVGSSPASVIPPSPDPDTVVQFMLRVRYYDKGGQVYEDRLRTWKQPSWYHPVDYNKSLGGGAADRFSPYTILDSISPGRAWINEINWNNGSKRVTHTDSKVVDNQFIEICVPSGTDMTGWKLKAYNLSGKEWSMATFGSEKVAKSKTTGGSVNGYEFFLLESPETNLGGNLRDADGNPVVSDGVWNSDSLSTVTSGTLSYANPYAFELVRPSGVVEHAFTIDGTNEWGTAQYEATNLLAVLNAADGSPKRFYAGRELEKNDNGVKSRGETFGSSGVTGGEATGRPAPGGDGTWEHGLDFTPGALNPGQVIPEGWFLPPNGTNSWVYFTVAGDHLRQSVGGDTSRTVLVIVPQGQVTNVVYTADPWYETATIAVDGETNAVHRPGTWRYDFTVPKGEKTTVRIVAQDGVDVRLDDDRFRLKGQRYRDAVLKWLGQEKWSDKDVDDIRFARWGCLKEAAPTNTMSLIEMYWLDIPPFNSEGSSFEERNPKESEWVFRGGFTDYKPNSIVRDHRGGKVTNSIFRVKLMITNEFSNAASAPVRLQGIANEDSSLGNYQGGWTSVNFKIEGFLDVNRDGGFNKGFLPFREFIFNTGSFAPKGDPGEFETIIELMDPFSGASAAGATYGWWRHPQDTPCFFRWRINHTISSPVTVEILKANDTYGD